MNENESKRKNNGVGVMSERISIYFCLISMIFAALAPLSSAESGISVYSAGTVRNSSGQNVKVEVAAGMVNGGLQSFLGSGDTEKLVFFRRGQEKGIGYQFVESMTTKLMENREWFTHYGEQDELKNSHLDEVSQVSFYKGKIMKVRDIKREIAMKTVSGAAADTFEKTPFGRKVKRIEETISSFMTMEYSKSVGEENAVFYLPGELSQDKMEEEKEYGVSVSSLFYADPDTLKGDFSVEMKLQYLGTRANTIFDLGERQVALELGNNTIDEYLGIALGVSMANKIDGETLTMVRISTQF